MHNLNGKSGWAMTMHKKSTYVQNRLPTIFELVLLLFTRVFHLCLYKKYECLFLDCQKTICFAAGEIESDSSNNDYLNDLKSIIKHHQAVLG